VRCDTVIARSERVMRVVIMAMHPERLLWQNMAVPRKKRLGLNPVNKKWGQ
jgi:hypothetical protein